MKTLKEKLGSRKFLVTIAGIVVVIGNEYFGFHLSNDSVFSIVSMIASYVLGQGYVDGKKAGK